MGQVRSGRKYWPDQTPVAGQQFEYGHDDIGNRSSTKAGGDQNGAGPRSANYSAHSLIQYTSRDVPGAVDIMGLSFATNSVTITSPDAQNNAAAVYRKGAWEKEALAWWLCQHTTARRRGVSERLGMGDESRATQAIGRAKRDGQPGLKRLNRRLEQVYESISEEVEA